MSQSISKDNLKKYMLKKYKTQSDKNTSEVLKPEDSAKTSRIKKILYTSLILSIIVSIMFMPFTMKILNSVSRGEVFDYDLVKNSISWKLISVYTIVFFILSVIVLFLNL